MQRHAPLVLPSPRIAQEIPPQRDSLGNWYVGVQWDGGSHLPVRVYTSGDERLHAWYDARQPVSPASLVALVLPHDGGWTVCPSLGQTTSREATWESVLALQQLAGGQGKGVRR